jgi:FdhD protein
MPPRGVNSTTSIRIWRVEKGRPEPRTDEVATEEPLEIRLRWGGDRLRTVAVTMRTPGADAELAAGFLFSEGVVGGPGEIVGVSSPLDPDGHPDPNVVEVAIDVGDGPEPDLGSLERHFFTSSACGVCGKAGLETLRLRVPADPQPGPALTAALLYSLPDRLRSAQGLFDATGGLHAAALFDAAGKLVAVREDVGRHNAVDKLVGWALGAGRLPLSDHLVLVSGRSSYEILQKCLVAGVPVVCAVSAPSSLAVELAGRFGITLVGFLRGDRCNVYSGVERLGVGTRTARLPVILTRS